MAKLAKISLALLSQVTVSTGYSLTLEELRQDMEWNMIRVWVGKMGNKKMTQRKPKLAATPKSEIGDSKKLKYQECWLANRAARIAFPLPGMVPGSRVATDLPGAD